MGILPVLSTLRRLHQMPDKNVFDIRPHLPQYFYIDMFKNLMNFSYKRGKLEAFGFYLAYLILILVLSMTIASILGPLTGNEDNFEFGLRIGNITAIVSSLFLSFTILHKKKLLNKFGYMFIALLSGLLAYFGGGILGLIPSAFLSTRKK